MYLWFSWATFEPERDVSDADTGRLVRCETLIVHRIEVEGGGIALLLGRDAGLAHGIAPYVELVGRCAAAGLEGHRPR